MRGNAGSGPRDGQFSQGSPGPGLAEALVAWALFGVVGVCVLITYSRVPPHELYHVHHGGFAGGLGRALVFLNWPVALMAIAVLAVVVDRVRAAERPVAIWPALPALVLCLMIGVPGVVDQAHLDAKWINVLPALGVLLVLGMTLWTIRVTGTGGAAKATGDRARILITAALAIVALPWIFAELGVYIGDLPLLGHVFRSKQFYFHDKELARSVHLGEHHGMVGFMLIVTALLLSRELPRMLATRLRTALAAYLSLLIAYGLGNMANDAWLEQVVKRDWTHWEIPGMTRPHLTWIWGVTILVAAAIFLRLDRDRRAQEDRPTRLRSGG
jgi:hypothetical protein